MPAAASTDSVVVRFRSRIDDTLALHEETMGTIEREVSEIADRRRALGDASASRYRAGYEQARARYENAMQELNRLAAQHGTLSAEIDSLGVVAKMP